MKTPAIGWVIESKAPGKTITWSVKESEIVLNININYLNISFKHLFYDTLRS